MDTKVVRTRIAPSPTGAPHIATLYSALFDYVLAKQNNGQFIWRIEDTDMSRYVEGSIEKLRDALQWLSIEADEDYFKGGEYGPYKQSERLDIYKKYADELIEKGYAYYCFCTKERLDEMRKKQEKMKVQKKYDRHCRNLAKEEVEKKLSDKTPYVIRMVIPDNETIVINDLLRGDIKFETNQIDDQVLMKSDGFPTYHLAVVVDDHLMKITHVLRGEEWLPSTPKHVLLYKYFGWEKTLYAHTPVLRNTDKSKMSKRKGDVSIHSYKEKGFLPEAIINYLGLLGNPNTQNIDIFDINYLIKNFSFERFPVTGPVFDTTKLEWMNGVYIRNMSVEELNKRVKPFITIDISNHDDNYLNEVLKLIQERLKRLDEVNDLIDFFYVSPQINLTEKKELLKDMYNLTNDYLDKENELETKIREYATEKGIKAGEAFTTLRDAVTGRKATPPLIPLMKVLGKKESLIRINNSIGE